MSNKYTITGVKPSLLRNFYRRRHFVADSRRRPTQSDPEPERPAPITSIQKCETIHAIPIHVIAAMTK